MKTKKGYADQLMMSLYTKEATYDAGVTMNAGNACQMRGYECDVTWPDVVVNDKDAVTTYEFGRSQELLEQRVEISYKEPRAKPNTIAGLAGLVMGSPSSVQDGGLTAYRHALSMAAYGGTLPSIQVEHTKGGIQYAYKGVKGSSFRLSGEAGKHASFEAKLIGSGTRATSATSYVSVLTESWLRLNNCKVWLESGTDISFTTPPAQGSENISSATPDDLKARIKSFDLSYDNALDFQTGFGGSGVYQDIDFTRRKIDLKWSMLFNDATELNYYLNQTALAMEFNLTSGTLVAGGGTFYYGVNIRVTNFQLKSAPLPKGGPNDIITCDFEAEIMNDATNSPLVIYVYNTKAAYLA